MSPLQVLRIAFRAVIRNKMRSFLTTLGVIIGVAAVVALVAIGEGAKAKVRASFESMGSNMLIILPGSTRRGGVRGGFGSLRSLTWDDLQAIRTEVPLVRTAAAVLHGQAQVSSEDQNWSTSVTGTSSAFFDIRNWPIALGSLFSPSDVVGGSKVVVLGQTVVDKLYGAGANPVGQSIRVNKVPFRVIGVLARKGQSPIGQDLDDAIFIPQRTFQAKIRGGLQKYINGVILASAVSPDDTAAAQDQITALLRERHRLRPSQEDDFSIRNLTELGNALQEGTQTLTLLLAAIAAVSLLVGGIGIMNIMLVSVTERTREIGIRMAVGAKPRHILSQFLVEALSLSVAGGLLGVALGMFLATRVAAKFGWTVSFRLDVVAVAIGFSALVGVVFGLYPALKASRLDPIDALRFE